MGQPFNPEHVRGKNDALVTGRNRFDGGPLVIGHGAPAEHRHPQAGGKAAAGQKACSVTHGLSPVAQMTERHATGAANKPG